MSSLPGLTLESYVAWNHDLIVNGDGTSNPSLEIAEAMGVKTRRRSVTAEQFAPMIALYEPYREQVENRLVDFDEDKSWRDYASFCFDFIPDSLFADAESELHFEQKSDVKEQS